MMRSKPMLWGAALAIALGSSAAFANVVVVKSLGPSAKAYPPGKTLPPSAKITLQGGDIVTLLGPSSAQTLRGPGNFDAGQISLASAAGQRGRFGALRAAEVAHNPSIWDIDVTQSGKVCVVDAKKLQLWRPDSDGVSNVEIHTADGQSQKLSWAAGKAVASWPSALPVKTGAQYQILVRNRRQEQPRRRDGRAGAERPRRDCEDTDRERMPEPARPAGRKREQKRQVGAHERPFGPSVCQAGADFGTMPSRCLAAASMSLNRGSSRMGSRSGSTSRCLMIVGLISSAK